MNPKHSNPTRPRRDRGREIFARAPYNFVPLPEKMVVAPDPPDQDIYHSEALTGWIDCELETRSPTYVRGMLTPDQHGALGGKKTDQLTPDEKEELAPFYASDADLVEGFPRPSIPGSSLRGMVRSLVEIAGYGRMRWVGKEPTFTFRAVAAANDDPLREPYQQALGRFGSRVQAGFLGRKGEDWFVVPAKTPESMGWPEKGAYLKVKERTIGSDDIPGFRRMNSPHYRPQWHDVTFDVRFGQGKRGRYVAISEIGSLEKGYEYRGVLVCAGNMLETSEEGQETPRRNHALVLLPDDKAKALPIRPQAVRDYIAGLTPFQKEELVHWGGARWGCLKPGAPVFYVSEGNEVVYFGHSPNFRIPARLFGAERAATPLDFVPEALRSSPRPDLADAIFGWVEEEGGGPKDQRAGRVFFGDARFRSAQDGVWYRPEPVAPRTLSGPKPTTFQHYLVQDREAGHDPDDKRSLAHYGTSPDETQIRGHKQYWHKGAEPEIEATAQERRHEKQLTRLVPLKAGVCFHFRIRFENLAPEELGALWWALALPGPEGHSYCHKLGMGKPLGMGAVEIRPTLTLTDRQARYQALLGKGQWAEAAAPVDAQPYLDAFERFVVKQVAPGQERLAQIERIQHLLAMLEWREGDEGWREATRYMEIKLDPEGAKINEYKERPVLPDPEGVVQRYARPGEAVRPPEPRRPAGPPSTRPGAQPPPEPKPQPQPPSQPSGARLTGAVKWFNDGKGYGFITQEERDDIFVHKNNVVGYRPGLLSEGRRVTYTVGQGKKGPQAENVQVL